MQSLLNGLAPDEGAEQIAYKLVEVALQDCKGRKFGKGTIYLADFSGECALFFCRAPALRRGASVQGMHRVKVGNAVARPASRPMLPVVDAWIAELAAEDFFEDPGAEADASDSHVSRLEAQLKDFQAQLDAAQRCPAVPALMRAEPKCTSAAPTTLLEQPGASLDAAALQQLRQLAGPPPKRLMKLGPEQEFKGPPASGGKYSGAGSFCRASSRCLRGGRGGGHSSWHSRPFASDSSPTKFQPPWARARKLRNKWRVGVRGSRRLGRRSALGDGSCPDDDRTDFHWLLRKRFRKRLSIKPYARLAAAPWIAANLAFLTDLDYLESMLKGNCNDLSDDTKHPRTRRRLKDR